MMEEKRTLGEFLADPRISRIAPDAIRNMDLAKNGMAGKTMDRLRRENTNADVQKGLERLYAAADTGEWFYPVYQEEDCAADETRRDVNLVFLPSRDEKASDRPYILVVPGGGFVNVWNLTEGWPVAAQFNELGYHVFVLTYRVGEGECILDREMEDFAAALRFIRANEKKFGVRGDRYITCGFSAGGYLVCLWNVKEKGYAAFGLPKPEAVFPVYAVTSWKLCFRDGHYSPESSQRLYGCDIETAGNSPFEIPEHAEGFPPCALFLAAGDELVNPEHSRILAGALEKLDIPCRLEIGPTGGHGFADGTGMCMEGWTERAVRWVEDLKK